MSSPSTTPCFSAYKLREILTMPDPDVPGPRYHTMLFVETDPDGSGIVHHVTGDLVTGMSYQTRAAPIPQESETFYDKTFLGTILASSYPSAINGICRAQPAPPVQKKFNPRTMRTEPFKADGTFYEPGEERAPLVKCTEWVERQAIPALVESGVLQRTEEVALPPSDSDRA